MTIIVYINHDHGLALAYFYGKVNFGHIGYSIKKGENILGNFVACDMKIGKYILLFELMKLCEYSRSRSFVDLDQRAFAY